MQSDRSDVPAYPHTCGFLLASAASCWGAAWVYALIWIGLQPQNPGVAALIGWTLWAAFLAMRRIVRAHNAN